MPASSHERQAQTENEIKPNSSHNEQARESTKGKHAEAFTRHHLFQVTQAEGSPGSPAPFPSTPHSNVTS